MSEDGEEAVSAAVDEMFDHIQALAWLRGYARQLAKDECAAIIRKQMGPLLTGSFEPWH